MPRQRSRSTSPEVRGRNTRDILGKLGLGGTVRTGGRSVGRGRGQQSVVQNPFLDPETGGAAKLLVLSATAQVIPAGGGYVTFDAPVVAQHGLDGVLAPNGDGWACPVSGAYALMYEHRWAAHEGGTIRLSLDGVLVPEGVIAQGVGDEGAGAVPFMATEGQVGRIWIDSGSDTAEMFDAVLRLVITDPDDEVAATQEWLSVFTGDAWGITNDGASWWTTEGSTGPTVHERNDSGNVLGSFEASAVGARVRGITWDGTHLWVHGDTDGAVARYTTAGALASSFNYYPAWAEQTGTGVAFDGTDLWLVGRDRKELRRYTTAGAHQQTISLAALTTPQGVTVYNSRLYVLDGGTATVHVFTLAGAAESSIDVSGSGLPQPYGIWIDSTGALYLSADGVGVVRRVATL